MTGPRRSACRRCRARAGRSGRRARRRSRCHQRRSPRPADPRHAAAAREVGLDRRQPGRSRHGRRGSLALVGADLEQRHAVRARALVGGARGAGGSPSVRRARRRAPAAARTRPPRAASARRRCGRTAGWPGSGRTAPDVGRQQVRLDEPRPGPRPRGRPRSPGRAPAPPGETSVATQSNSARTPRRRSANRPSRRPPTRADVGDPERRRARRRRVVSRSHDSAAPRRRALGLGPRDERPRSTANARPWNSLMPADVGDRLARRRAPRSRRTGPHGPCPTGASGCASRPAVRSTPGCGPGAARRRGAPTASRRATEALGRLAQDVLDRRHARGRLRAGS